MRIAECGFKSKKTEINFGVRIAECGLMKGARHTAHGARERDFGLRIADFGIGNADCGFWI